MRRASLCVWAAVALASCVSDAVAPTPAPLRELVPQPSPLIAAASESPTATPSATATVGVRLAVATGDFDCDGRPDRIEFFERVAPADGLPRLARLFLSTGAVYELAFAGVPQTDDAAANPLIGIADVNGDRCDDAIVSVGHGASTTWTSFLVFDGKDLRRVEEDGKPVMFLFAGSVRHGNAIECRRTKDAPEIVVRAISDYTSDYQWDVVEDVHRWSTKSRLILWATTRTVIPVPARDFEPPDSERYWGLSCGSVKLLG